MRAAFLRRFAADARGVSAIEFAFIAPILIVFYFGMAETCQLLIAQRRVNHSAAAVADLVSQTQGATTKAALDDRLLAGQTIMAPFPQAGMTMRLTSVTKGAGTAPATVDWSYPAGGLSKGATFTPSTPLNAGESVIVAQATYNYTSAIGYFLPGVQVLTHKAELRPRKEDTIACTNC
jgi:Flp pilus assembly protein TadG